MIKNLVRIGVAVLTTLLAIVVLWQFRVIVGYVLISLMLAASIRPLFRRLEGQRIIARLFWIFIYIIVVAGVGLILSITIRASASELQGLAQSVSVQDVWILPLWSGSTFQQEFLANLPAPSLLFQAIIGNEGELIIPALLGIVQGIGGVVAAIAIILILSVYWSINQIHFERLWLSLLPSEQRTRARGIWRTIEPDIGAYLRGQVIYSMLAGILLGFGYWLIGSPSPALLALTGALASLIPVVGGILAIALTLIIGLLTNVQVSLLTVLYASIIFGSMTLWVKPRLFKRKWGDPILTLVLLIAMADAFGIVGIIIAPPISAIAQLLWNRLITRRAAAGSATRISDLKERLAHLRETVSAMDEPHLPLVTSSLERISNLIDSAEPIVERASLGVSSKPVLHLEQE